MARRETVSEIGQMAGRDHARPWRDVWVPNEIDFDRTFAPREHAEIRYAPADGPVETTQV